MFPIWNEKFRNNGYEVLTAENGAEAYELACQEKPDIIITDFAVNLNELNSEYDDYNLLPTFPAQRMDIYFSSNRNSLGNDFDIVAGKMDFSFHSEDDILNVSIPNDNPPWESEMIFPKINTENNEFGPFTYYSGDDMLFMYATKFNDTFDINFIELTNWHSSKEKVVSNPLTISKINEFGDNLYPTIGTDKTELFFCSNITKKIRTNFKEYFSLNL